MLKTPAKKRTAKPPHPDSHVKQVMDDLGLSINAFARKLDVASATIHRVVTEKSAISPEMAIRLSATVGHTAKYWLQFQTDYDLYYASKRVDTSELKLLTKVARKRKTVVSIRKSHLDSCFIADMTGCVGYSPESLYTTVGESSTGYHIFISNCSITAFTGENKGKNRCNRKRCIRSYLKLIGRLDGTVF